MQLTRTLGVVVMLTVFGGGPASADIYVWRDSAGVSHYVNDLENVPSEYRKDAIPVAKDWARAGPPPAPAEPSPTPAAIKPEAAGPSSSARDIYEAAYAAGFHAAEEVSPPPASTNVGPIVQYVEIQPQPQIVADYLMPLPLFVERRHHSPKKPDRDRTDISKRFPPASRAPFLEGPAGPPPLGAAGPPPVRFEQ